MTNDKLNIENGKYNRYEVLDKIDVLHKLIGINNKFINVDKDMYDRICKEIDKTSKSTARLFLFDNKHYIVCSLSIVVYDKLFKLLDDNLPINVEVEY